MGFSRKAVIVSAGAVLLLTGCARPASAPLDTDRLNAAIDRSVGGLDTCVIALDVKSGARLYQYGRYDICTEPAPPCETFEPVIAITAAEAGAASTTGVEKWDGSPQPVRAWQRDANLHDAFAGSVAWWFRKAADRVGATRMGEALRRLSYGDGATANLSGDFWSGPAAGGGLAITPRDQARFMRSWAAGALPVAGGAAAATMNALPVQTSGGSTLRSLAGSCPDAADRSRSVGWWMARATSPGRDFVVVAMVASADAPPGSEIGDAVTAALAEAKAWP